MCVCVCVWGGGGGGGGGMLLPFIQQKFGPSIRFDIMKDHLFNASFIHFSTLSFQFLSFTQITLILVESLLKSKTENKTLPS